MNQIPTLKDICINILMVNNYISLYENRITKVNKLRVKTIYQLYDKCKDCNELFGGFYREILSKMIIHSSDAFLEQLNEDELLQLKFEDILDVIKYDLNLCRGFLSNHYARFEYSDNFFHKTKYKTSQLFQAMLERNSGFLKLLSIQTQELCDVAFNNDCRCIEFIDVKFINNDMRLKAVKTNGLLLRFLINSQTTEICTAAVNQNGLAIGYVKKEFRTPVLCLLAANRDFQSIKLMPDEQTDEICNLYFDNNDVTYTIKFINKEFLTPEFCAKAIKKNSRNIQFVPIEKLTYQLCKEAVTERPFLLEYVNKKFQTLELFRISIGYSYFNYRYIKKITPELCFELFSINPEVFREIGQEFQTEELCLAAVRYNGHFLEYVKLKNLEICLAAVKNDPSSFCYVEEQFQTEEICLIAINYDWEFMDIIINQTIKLCSAALHKSKCKAYGLIRDKTEEISCLTVEIDPYYLEHVEQSIAICYAAVKKKCSVFKYVKAEFQSDDICLLAVQGLGLNLKYVKVKTIKICSAAIEKDPNAIIYVDKKFKNIFKNKRLKIYFLNL